MRKTGDNLLQLHLYTFRPPVIYLSGSFMKFTYYAPSPHLISSTTAFRRTNRYILRVIKSEGLA